MSRVLFISGLASGPWGGSEELWSQAARHLHARGNNIGIQVKWWPRDAPPIAAFERDGCAVRRREPGEFIPRAVNKLARFAGRDPEAEWCRAFAPDLAVISQAGNTDGLAWMEMCRRLRIPYAVIVQCNGDVHWPRNDGQRAALAACYDAAVECYFVSKHNLELARRQFVTDFSNGVVVSNPFNVSYDSAIDWPGDDAPFNMACVGRLDPHAKGQDVLFEVLRQPEWRARPLRVELVGAGGYAKSLAHWAERDGLTNVTFSGHVNDIAGVWQRNHALLMPSRYEGLPLAIVEAMLCARPCIVTDVGGNAELVEHGRSGFVAPFPTRAAFGAAMECAWLNRHRWEEMGLNAAQRVRELVPADPGAALADKLSGWLH